MVTFKWVASGLLILVVSLLGAWGTYVTGFGEQISELRERASAQGAIIETMAKQVDEIHRFFQPVEKDD